MFLLRERGQYVAQSSSPHSVPYDRSIAFFRAISPQSAIQCFLFRVPVFSRSLKLSYSCLHLLPRVHVPCICPSVICLKCSSYPSCIQYLHENRHDNSVTSFRLATQTAGEKTQVLDIVTHKWLLWPQRFVSFFSNRY